MPDSFTMHVLPCCDLDSDARDVLLNRGGASLGDQALRSDIPRLVKDAGQPADAALGGARERLDGCVPTVGELRVVPRQFAEARGRLDPRGGVTAETFRMPTAIAELSRGTFQSLAIPMITFVDHEGFLAYAASAQIRPPAQAA